MNPILEGRCIICGFPFYTGGDRAKYVCRHCGGDEQSVRTDSKPETRGVPCRV